MYIIFLGAPGAGKGTQAANAARQLNLVHLATGDLFRQALEQGTALGLQAKSYMEKGTLVPDEITIRMVLERISAPDLKSRVVFDGFPRNRKQAEALDKALAGQGKAIDKVMYINVSEKELVRRLSGRWSCHKCQTPYHITDAPPKIQGRCDRCGGELYQRSDDTAEAVKRRLQVYFAETTPLIDYYSRSNKLVEIDGEGEVAEVTERLIAAIAGEKSVPVRQKWA
ncbi:MAG: adenylate kinase [Chloroflexi bacterium]|nr:adenylate kinase [Chloroflexota bacterium]